jgi:hypothetical protein
VVLDGLTTSLAAVSNDLVTIILPAVTNLSTDVGNIYTSVVSSGASILTKPPYMKDGSSMTMLYKTRSGLLPAEVRIDVNGVAGYPQGMTEVVGGI